MQINYQMVLKFIRNFRLGNTFYASYKYKPRLKLTGIIGVKIKPKIRIYAILVWEYFKNAGVRITNGY